MQSTSEPSAITGLPDPQRAVHAVGIPATPSCTVNPFCRRIAVRNFVVSNSWNPSSPKLKTESFHFWMFSCIPSTSRPAFCLYWSASGDEAPVATGPVGAASAAGCRCCAPTDAVAIASTPQRVTHRFIARIRDGLKAVLYRDQPTDPPGLLRLRFRRGLLRRRILDPELIEIVLVLRRVVVVLPHL